jgi:hypothetical protein
MIEVLVGIVIGAVVTVFFVITAIFLWKREQTKEALVGAVVGGFFAIAGTLLGLYLGPPIQIKSAKYARVRETKVAYREFVRAQMKRFFVDYANLRIVLVAIGRGELPGLSMAEEVHPLTEILRENLGCLESEEMLAVSLALGKEYQMASRRRVLNMRVQETIRRKISEPNATITVELQDMKSALEWYLHRHIELNALMYQGLASLGVDDFVYLDRGIKSHEEVFQFWKSIKDGLLLPDDPNDLAPYIPRGFDETE